LLVQNGIFSVELTHLDILEHECRVHDITVRFRDDRNQEVKENDQNQELVHEPNNPNQVDTKLRNPVGLLGDNANFIMAAFVGVIRVINAMEFVGPEAIGWVADVS
jgi:hypothetical protein